MKKAIVVLALVMGLAFSGLGFSGYATAADTPAKGAPQTKCPVLSGTIDKKVYTDYEGKRIYFCCPGCIAVFKKDPAKYLKQMEEQGIVPEKAPVGK